MRWTWVPHLWGLLTPAVTVAGLLMGGWWMASTLVLLLLVYPVLDLLLGTSKITHPLQEGTAHNVIVHLHATAVLLVVGVLFWRSRRLMFSTSSVCILQKFIALKPAESGWVR